MQGNWKFWQNANWFKPTPPNSNEQDKWVNWFKNSTTYSTLLTVAFIYALYSRSGSQTLRAATVSWAVVALVLGALILRETYSLKKSGGDAGALAKYQCLLQGANVMLLAAVASDHFRLRLPTTVYRELENPVFTTASGRPFVANE